MVAAATSSNHGILHDLEISRAKSRYHTTEPAERVRVTDQTRQGAGIEDSNLTAGSLVR